jgi:hypothetical protein
MAAVVAIMAGTANAATVYNRIPKPKPGNLVSQAFQATQTSEFGGQVEFAGTARNNPTVTVVMSSWACGNLTSGAGCETAPGATFAWPITLNVYKVGAANAPGEKVATVTQTFPIPYRPSANPKCPLTSEGVVGWGKSCFSGLSSEIKFSLPGVTLPNPAIISIAYNTTDYGYEPTHSPDVGEDSLNVGLYEPGERVHAVGTDPLPENLYIDSATASNYCGGGPTGTFSLTGACWEGYEPAIKVQATKH